MVIQYPDTIIITRNGISVQDDDGNWITTPDEVIELECRFVPNGSGKSITTADGKNLVYDYQIAFPVGTTNIKPQDSFVRTSNDEKGIIKRFEIGQLHSVAWV